VLSEDHPSQIGPYKILRVLGEGAMGLVYEAEQTETLRRRVALKVMKPGLESKEVLGRFEAERQALAVMEHPGIAKVLDAGTTEDGVPYFAMELVRGEPLNDYADSQKLSVDKRVELFVKVCQAVQHAHQKGVIHRDLKPSNVLITERDGVAQPKVIDFGIAKAVGQRLTERTLVTQFGQAIGTPAYMSPEQAEMSGLDVDTRTDIYALGVMLYGLLVGRLPADPAEMGFPAFVSQLAMRETDPPRPSTRYSTLQGEYREAIARFRATDPRGLRRELERDLDWIVMKALEKDRNRRYETANGLASDLMRHLNDEPVRARAPSTRYRMSKFVARHKVGVAFVVVLFALLAASAVFMTVSRNRAVAAERQAKLEATKSVAINDFLEGMLSSADPWRKGREVRVADVLAEAANEIETAFAGQPEVEAGIRTAIGRTYRNLGLFDEAEPQLEAAVAASEEITGEDSPELADVLAELAELRRQQGDYDAAEALHREALAIRQAAYGGIHSAVAESLNDIGDVLLTRGDYPGAEEYLQPALQMRRDLLGNESWEAAESLNGLGGVYYFTGAFEDAEASFREALDINRQLSGDEHLDVAMNLNDLAMTLNALERYEEAEPLYQESLAIKREFFGDQHPGVAQSLNNLAMFYYRTGQLAQAEPLFRESLAMNRSFFGTEHIEVASNLNNLGLLLREREEYDEAETYLREAIAIDRNLLGENNPKVANTMINLAATLTRAGRLDEAERTYREARAIQLGTFPEDHWRVATTESLLGGCLTHMDCFAEAETLLVNSYRIISENFEPSHGRTQAALRRVVEMYEGWGKSDKASEYRALLSG